MSGWPVLSVLTFLPLTAALVSLGARRRSALAFGLTASSQILCLFLAIGIWLRFDAGGGLQFVERHTWIPSLAVDYFLGVDGLGLLMVTLTALVGPMAAFAAWWQGERDGLYYSLMLLLQTGLFGTFTALNFFHWFIFWELSLVPAFFLIRLWGGLRRSQAAVQFFVYTMVGSIGLLLAFLAVFLASGSFDFLQLAEWRTSGRLQELLDQRLTWGGLEPGAWAFLIFLGAFLGFAVKVPLIPFHTWLPISYVEAPSTTTMLLTGVMSKMGVYGFLRVLLPIFPEQLRAASAPLLVLAVATIVLSAWAALAQRDLKRLFAYSSINHLGYCLLGIFAVVRWTAPEELIGTERAAALNGVLVQMLNHGLTASALFCFVAFLEKRSQGRRGINDFGGLRQIAPVFCGLMGITMFASLGLPGLNGFVGEFLIFKGTFALAAWAAALSVVGLLVTAIFLLTVMQRVFHGPLNERWSGMPDLRWPERFLVLPTTVLIFVLGVWPQWVIGKINPTVMEWVDRLAL